MGRDATSKTLDIIFRSAFERMGVGSGAVAESPRAKLRSPTHAEVYDLVVQGLSNEEIAERLSLTPRTVKYRISGILETTGHTNRVELIAAHGLALSGKKKVDGLKNALAGERQKAVYDLLV